MIYTSYDGGISYGCASELFNGELFYNTIEYIKNIETDENTKKMYQEHTKPAFKSEEIQNHLQIAARKADVKDEFIQTDMLLSVDYPEDFLVCSHLANLLVKNKGMHFSHLDLITAYNKNKDLYRINEHLHSGFGE